MQSTGGISRGLKDQVGPRTYQQSVSDLRCIKAPARLIGRIINESLRPYAVSPVVQKTNLAQPLMDYHWINNSLFN